MPMTHVEQVYTEALIISRFDGQLLEMVTERVLVNQRNQCNVDNASDVKTSKN